MSNERINFYGEIPISSNNAIVNERTFIIETWFRRILFTALMIKYGNHWIDFLSQSDRNKYYQTRTKYLDDPIRNCCESDNILWFINLNRLIELIKKSELNDLILEMTGKESNIIANDLDELRIIRNTAAHSRVVTMLALRRSKELSESLESSIHHYKRWILYPTQSDSNWWYRDNPNDPVSRHLLDRMEDNDWKYFQATIEEKKYYYSLTQLPAHHPSGEFNNDYIDVESVLIEFQSVLNCLIGFFINLTGSEYYILWSKHPSIEKDDQFKIIDLLFDNKHKIWTPVCYEKQDESYVCNPLIWFYENSSPYR